TISSTVDRADPTAHGGPGSETFGRAQAHGTTGGQAHGPAQADRAARPDGRPDRRAVVGTPGRAPQAPPGEAEADRATRTDARAEQLVLDEAEAVAHGGP